jgi:hypothetical protein
MKKKTLSLILIFALFTPLMIEIKPANTQFLGSVYIKEDGSVEGTKDIFQNGNTYTLKTDVPSGIQVQKSNIVIDGAGFTVNGNGGVGIDLTKGVGQDSSRPTISNVTVKNLRIVDCSFGVDTNGGGNHTFYGDYVSNYSTVGISLSGNCCYNRISFCTIIGKDAVGFYFQSNYNSVTNNNMLGYVQVWLSGNETFESNYWGNYDTHGDSHPLMSPVAIPAFPDAASPFVSVISPENKNYNSSSISLVFAVDEPIVWAGYSLDGRENVTFSGNTTISELSNGLHSLIVFANDTFGNMGASEIVSFTVAVPEPFPTTPLIGSVVAVAAVAGLGLFVYFKKRGRQQGMETTLTLPAANTRLVRRWNEDIM